jgi:uncharacterized protein YdhG (YjbR/CyaY superfamily)
VTTHEIDTYLEGLDETKRATLAEVRRRILTVIPDAEQVISYRLPAFRVDGAVVAGVGAFRSHLSYLPHSGVVLTNLATLLDGFERTTGSLHFPVDEPLSQELVDALVAERLRDIRSGRRHRP